MRISCALPNIGPVGSADSIMKVAERAEELGYEGLWTIERLLYPLKPKTPYPVTPDGSLPEPYKNSLDPVDSLAFAAARTKRIALGTSVLDLPYYNPVLLARRLTTVDVLSRGRLKVGLGLGWSQDEFDATGADFRGRGARADEFVEVLKRIWTTDPVEFEGKFYRVPRSHILPKPVQKPHPPLFMAAFVPAALKRLATVADGWNPVAIPVEGMKSMFDSVKEMAKAAGRDPAKLQMVVRANVEIHEKPLGEDRLIFSGSLEQIQADIEGSRKIGAHELIFDFTFDSGAQRLEGLLGLMERFRKMV
jgi:probable F420-dependent oxidoreductase